MNTTTLIALALIAFVLRLLPRILEFIKLKRWSATIPGPTMGELIANVKKGQILSWFKELRQKYGPTFCIWFGKDLIVFFTDPDDIKQVLSNHTLTYKSTNYDVVKPWLGKGILTNGGNSWHTRRKMLTPAFHFRILSQFKEPMEENCRILVRKLNEKINGQEFDIYPYITLFALDVICETAMGFKKNAQMHSDSEYVRAVQAICRILHKKSFSFWQRNNIFFKYTQPGRESSAALKIIHNETDRVIKLRRKMLQDSHIGSMSDAEKSNNDVGKRRLAFLDMLLISQMQGESLTDQEIREEVDTFMFAGHDTTSSTLGFAIYLLSQHKEVQQQAYEEARALEGNEKESMPYIEAVIKETLRIYPAVPSFSRYLHEDLQVGSLTVPKGASVSVSAYIAHRYEKDYPEPEKFDPMRFLQSDKVLHPFSFVPFSAGPRNCIGQKYAMLELKCSLSYLLRSYEFLPAEGFAPQPLPEIVTKSGNGIKICLKVRN